MKRILCIGVLAKLLASSLCGQDMTGDWQGTLKAGPQELRLVVKIRNTANAGWNATLFSIDQSPDWGVGIPASSLTLQGSNLKFSFDAVGATYEGKISADGASVAGKWTQGLPLPLDFRHATPETTWKDPCPHTVRLVSVDKDVMLEVLDWGGAGRPVVLLAGLGNTAHIYDKFAPKLTASHHVYGITRRGYGISSTPPAGYSADRLGDDVLAVLDSLGLDQPVLVGHSIAGEELSSVGSRYPAKIAGLIYLDAGYAYAYYDPSRGDLNIDLIDLEGKMEQLRLGRGPRDIKPLVQELLDTTLPEFERDLREKQQELQVTPDALLAVRALTPMSAPAQAIMAGVRKYSKIPVPLLAIYAIPHDVGPLIGNDPAERAAYEARDEATTQAQAKAFESGVPSARVVRLPHADHFLFLLNEADVLREMTIFFNRLSKD